MKRHGIWSPPHQKTLVFVTCVTGLILALSLHVQASPTWGDSPAALSAADFGRNIRQLPCVSRRTGETGICMFAYSCAKANGTHLGTCIDRFYFGSCCKTQENAEVEVNEPDNYLNNNLDNNEVGSAVTSNGVKFGQPSTDRIQTSSSTAPYKPTSQFALQSSSISTTTPRNQYTGQPSVNGLTKPTAATYSTTGATSAAPSTSQSTKPSSSPYPSTSSTFSTAKPTTSAPPSKQPSSSFKPSSTTSKPKPPPHTAKPTVQFSVPGSSANVPSSSSTPQTPTAASATTQNGGGGGLNPTSTYTGVTSMRPLNSSAVTATYSTTKPSVKPSSSTASTNNNKYSSSPSPSPSTTTTPLFTPSKPKPVTGKPKPTTSNNNKPVTSTDAPALFTPSTGGVHSTVDTSTAGTSSHHHTATRPNQNFSNGPSTATSPTSPTSTAPPTLVTWTTLDQAPPELSESTTKTPPTFASSSPKPTENSTLPPWIKVPVETHEPNTVPTKETSSPYATTIISSSTASYTPIAATTSKPNVAQSTPDIDLLVTSSGLNTGSNNQNGTTNSLAPDGSTLPTSQTPSSTPSINSVIDPVTDSNEAGSAPLNMSNYREVCGRRLFPNARIVGGEKVTFGKWPWQISLRQWRTSTYLHKCGAALFNENWAVTAAHCVENVPPSDLLLRLGEHDLSIEEEPYGYEERRVQIVASHPKFDPRTFEYDLALLRFHEPVKFQPNIVPICVPEDDYNFVGSTAHVTGWGRLYEDGPLPSVLQEVTVPVINNSVCETMYRSAGYIEHIPDIFICAGWKKGGFDSCEGDSGGPMVIQRPDKRWLLAGIISWGIGCAEPNQPGVYTRISKFRDWINLVLNY